MNNINSSNLMARSKFNAVICGLVAMAFTVFFFVANTVDPSHVAGIGGFWLFLGAIVAMGAIIYGVYSVRNPALKTAIFLLLPALLGYVGSPWLAATSGAVLYEAIALTVLSAGIMMILSGLYPDFFVKIQGILFGSLIALILVGIVGTFFFQFDMTIYHLAAIAIFLGFLGYDFVQARRLEPTYDNAIIVAMNVFIDLLNLLQHITSALDLLDD